MVSDEISHSIILLVGMGDAFWHPARMGLTAFETDGEATREADCCKCTCASRSPLALITLLLPGPNSWCASMFVAGGTSLVLQAPCCSTLLPSCR